MTDCKTTDEEWIPCQECEESIDGMMDEMLMATTLQAISMVISIANTFEHHGPSLLMRMADDFTTQALFQYVKSGRKKHYEEVMQLHSSNVLFSVDALQAKFKEEKNAIKVRKAAPGNAGGGAWSLDPGDPTEGSA